MLLPIESTGLAIKGLIPQLKACIARLGGNRPVVLSRATYASYPATQTNTILTFTFDAFALHPGDQISIVLYGTLVNPSAFVDTFDVVVSITQSSAFSYLEAVHAAIDHTTSNAVAWNLDAALSFNLPRASGQYALSPSAKTAGQQLVSGLWSNSAIAVGGKMKLEVTNDADFSAFTTGGQIVSTSNTGTFLIATRDVNQMTLQNSVPTRIDVQITTSTFVNYTVQGGFMLGI